MLRTLLALSALLGFSVVASPSAPDEDAVRDLAQTWIDTWNAHDAEANLDLFADGALQAWPDGREVPLVDRAAFLEQTRQFHAYAADFRLNVTLGEIRVGEGAAVVFVTGTRHAPDQPDMPLHILLAMEEGAEGWRITANHTMALLTP